MSDLVYNALKLQKEVTGQTDFVFCTRNHIPLCTNNFTNRIWRPTLNLLNLRYRRPYQTRHTLVDTLMFAFRIQKDNSLVNVLGSGLETTNEDVLREWIKNSLINPDLQIAESVLPILIERLEQ